MSGRLSTLCALCTDLFSYEGLLALSAEAGFAYESFDQVKCQAAEGCALCSFLSGFSHAAGQKPAFTLRATQWFGAQPHDPQFYHYKIGGDTKRLNHPFHDQPLAHVECRMESGCITWYAFAEEDDPAAAFVKGRPMAVDVSSDRTFEEARHWLNECGSTHHGNATCPPLEEHILPTRLVDVGDAMVSPSLHISDKGQRGHYAALSYVWGGQQTYQTTMDTISEKVNGMPIAKLPKTIQDAIIVTRQLRIKYLWVDVFCIIQDSEEDKSQEIARMAETFKNSVFTISASTSKSAEAGFLEDRPRPQAIRFPFHTTGDREGTVSLILDEWIMNFQDGCATESRAWCFEEALLPSRRLVYGPRELQWVCKAYPLGRTVEPSHIHSRGLYGMLPLRTWDTTKPLVDDDRVQWTSYVTEYNRRSLTKSKDRANAILGVAQVLSKLWNEDYIHGCFVQHLSWQLHWAVPTWARSKPSVIDVPSWSWLSVERADFDRSSIMYTMAECVLDAEKQLDQLRSGILTLKAQVCSFKQLTMAGEDMWTFLMDGEDNFRAAADGAKAVLVGRRHGKECCGILVKPSLEGRFRRVGYFETMAGKDGQPGHKTPDEYWPGSEFYWPNKLSTEIQITLE